MIHSTFIFRDTTVSAFVMLPAAVATNETLSMTARIAYGILLSRAMLSQKNSDDWTNDDGQVYCFFPVGDLAKQLDRGKTQTESALNELERNGLLYREKIGFNRPNRLYVKVPLDDSPAR